MTPDTTPDQPVEEQEESLFRAPPLAEQERMVEAILFASAEPVSVTEMNARMPHGCDASEAVRMLAKRYEGRGVSVVRVGDAWAIRTAPDLGFLMRKEIQETRKLSRAAIEVLAIIAYHQPVTRAEIEEIRGVVTSKGTLDVLLETGWIKPRGRRKTPGRPLTFGTTESFLSQFTLESLGDLPGLEELKGTGLLDSRLPAGFNVPMPSDDPALREDEEPLEEGDSLELTLVSVVEPEQAELQAEDEAAEAGADVSAGEEDTSVDADLPSGDVPSEDMPPDDPASGDDRNDGN